MYEGTGPYVPGMLVDPEGWVAESLAPAAPRRPKLRLIQSPARPASAPRVIRIDAVRSLRQRHRVDLLGVALASAAGIVGGAIWCAALALVAWRVDAKLGDAGAFALVAAIQLGTTGAAISWLRGRMNARTPCD